MDPVQPGDDLATKTTDALLDRLRVIEREVTEFQPLGGTMIGEGLRPLLALMRESALILTEIARRTATGWRPL